MLDDTKLLRVSEICRWRFTQLILLAGACDMEGILATSNGPMSIDDLAVRLRVRADRLEEQLNSLANVGVIELTAAGWRVCKFASRQGRKQSEKREQWREAASKSRQTHDKTAPDWQEIDKSLTRQRENLAQNDPDLPTKTPNVINDTHDREEKRRDRVEERREGADAPPPKAHKEVFPAVEAFRAAAGTYPVKALWQGMDEAVGQDPTDVSFWGQVVSSWIAKGWNPRNVSGMFDFYKRRELPGGSSGPGRSEPKGFAAVREFLAQEGVKVNGYSD